MSPLQILAAIVLPLCLFSSCTTVEYDSGQEPGRPYIPRVTMPEDLNENEAGRIGQVEQALEANGLRPTDRQTAEYQLQFSIEDGPVNADVTLELWQGRNRVAHAFARVGGPRMVFQRQRVIQEAFRNALEKFETQLPRGPVSPGYDSGARPEWQNSPENNLYRNSPGAGGYGAEAYESAPGRPAQRPYY